MIKLGDTAKDTITGYTGTVVAITNWLNGCQRITIQSPNLHNGCPVGDQTFDVEQVKQVTSKKKIEPSRIGGPSIPPVRKSNPV